jgi:hypothetical protein
VRLGVLERHPLHLILQLQFLLLKIGFFELFRGREEVPFCELVQAVIQEMMTL